MNGGRVENRAESKWGRLQHLLLEGFVIVFGEAGVTEVQPRSA